MVRYPSRLSLSIIFSVANQQGGSKVITIGQIPYVYMNCIMEHKTSELLTLTVMYIMNIVSMLAFSPAATAIKMILKSILKSTTSQHAIW